LYFFYTNFITYLLNVSIFYQNEVIFCSFPTVFSCTALIDTSPSVCRVPVPLSWPFRVSAWQPAFSKIIPVRLTLPFWLRACLLDSHSLFLLAVCLPSKGGQRYFFGGCAFARMLPFFIRSLALDRNDFKFAIALSAIPL
jgi:hypothetical protein